MKPEKLPEGLVQILMAFLQDPELRKWFEGMALETPAFRSREFRATAARMEASKDHRDLRHALTLLALPEFYESAIEALEALDPAAM
jgi:hypothetical protein